MSLNYTYRIIIDDTRVTLPIVASLTDNSRGVIYTRNVFIILAYGVFITCKLLYLILFISGKKVADRLNSKSLCNTKNLTEDSSEKVNKTFFKPKIVEL
jgi:hypothetical protein